MNLLQYNDQIKELKLILSIVINIVDSRISKSPTNNVYSDIHTQLRDIKNELDRNFVTDTETKDSEFIQLINTLQLNKSDPVVFRLLKQIKNSYLQISDYQLNEEEPNPSNLM